MVPTSDGPSSAQDDNLQDGQVFVLHHEELEAASINVLLNHIQNAFNVSSLICLGPLSTTVGNSHSVLTPSEYCVRLFRKFNLHANEREVLLGMEDQLIATQLCLAELNKKITGDFDVEVSKVLEFNKRLQTTKLKTNNDAVNDTDNADELNASLIQHTVCSGSEVDFDSFICQYTDFLKFNNNIDIMDVITRLRKELTINEELQKVIRGDNFLLLDTTKDNLESAIFSLLAADKQIHWVRLEESLISADSQATIKTEQIKLEVTNINCIINTTPADVFSTSHKTSATAQYIEKLMLGYLHLLVNTRSEIALARVINVPERGINHEAFTEIKHLAQIKQLAMYQTVTSFVLKLRFGGHKNTSCTNSKLSQHIKGLSEFTDMMHKLQTILEEDLDTRSAVKRVLNLIKRLIISCHDNMLRPSSVELVTDRLQDYAIWVINVMQTIINNSPERSVSVGGSVVGRQSLRVLRCILDHAATQPPMSSVLDTLTDVISSQKTPLKFPSIMSQFRSPIETSPHAAESKSLVQRIKEKHHFEKKRSKIQCDSFLDWAKPLPDKVNEDREVQFAGDHYVPSSKTIVHPGSKCLEAMMDKENICSVLPEKCLSADNNTHPCSTDTRTIQVSTSSKRPLNVTVSETNAKRIRMMDSAVPQVKKPKTSRRKLVPLQKGQKTLNAFFRI